MATIPRITIVNIVSDIFYVVLVSTIYYQCLGFAEFEASYLALQLLICGCAARIALYSVILVRISAWLNDRFQQLHSLSPHELSSTCGLLVDFPRRYATLYCVVWVLFYPLYAILLFTFADITFDAHRITLTAVFSLFTFSGVISSSENRIASTLRPIVVKFLARLTEGGQTLNLGNDSLQRRARLFACGVIGSSLCWVAMLGLLIVDSNIRTDLIDRATCLQSITASFDGERKDLWRGSDQLSAIASSSDFATVIAGKIQQTSLSTDEVSILEAKLASGMRPPAYVRGLSRAVVAREASNSRGEAVTQLTFTKPRPFALTGFGTTIGLFSGLAVIIGLVNTIYFSSRIVKPTKSLCSAFHKVFAEGQINSHALLAIESSDEIGQLTAIFNASVQKLKSVTAAADKIARGTLAVEVDGKSDLDNAFMSMVNKLQRVTNSLNREAEELTAVGKQISQQAEASTLIVLEQTEGVDELSHKTDRLQYASEAVVLNANEILQSARSSQRSSIHALRRVDHLKTALGQVRDLLMSIQRISKQSRVLSLNIEIESARQHSHHDGLAAIAGEARRLNEQVNDSAKSVRKLLLDIEKSFDATRDSVQTNGQFAEDTLKLAQAIRKSATENDVSRKEMAEKLEQLNSMFESNVRYVELSGRQAIILKEQSNRIGQLIQRLGHSIELTESASDLAQI